jgi:hypothetical protein
MKYIKTPEFITIACFTLFFVLGIISKISIENVSFVQNGTSEKVSIPLLRDIEVNNPFNMEFDVVSPFNFSYDMMIVPDDCADRIKIGEHTMDLSDVHGHCSYSKGFTLEDSVLAPYRQGGKTHYSVTLHNGGGPGGFMAFIKMKSVAGQIIHALAIISFALFFAFIALRLRMGKTLMVLLFLGILFRSFFYLDIPYKRFSMDVEGHIEYIQYVINNHSIPGKDECWSCYHPPVYYIAAAPSYVLGEYLGMQGTTGLQAFSLLLSVLTTFFGLLFLKKILERGPALVLSSALWVFWPLMILVAPRIGNDQLFFFLHVLCVWAGICYVKDCRGKYLIMSVIAAALAMWTKSTGIVSLGMVFVFAVSGFFANRRWQSLSKSEIISWILFVAAAIHFAVRKLLGDELVGNANALNSGMRVPNETANYLYFDLQNFLTQPFTSGWDSSMGRDYFWNFMLKSSMFGEWTMLSTPAGRFWATMMSVFLLGLIVYAIRGFWRTRLNLSHWILLLQGVAFIASLMALRIKYPFGCSNDFRYILPVLLSFCPFVAIGVTLKGSSVKWKVVGYSLVFAFIVSSSVLYIMLM